MSKTTEAQAALEAAATKIKKLPRMVKIDLGYSCQLLVPAAKSGAVIALLAECTRTRSEVFSTPEGNYEHVQVIDNGEIEMKMGSFEVATNDDFQTFKNAMNAHKNAIASDLADEAASN